MPGQILSLFNISQPSKIGYIEYHDTEGKKQSVPVYTSYWKNKVTPDLHDNVAHLTSLGIRNYILNTVTFIYIMY